MSWKIEAEPSLTVVRAVFIYKYIARKWQWSGTDIAHVNAAS